VAENAVSKHITPFADAAREATLSSQESLVALRSDGGIKNT
jgi:hypothetical protein